MAAADDWPPCVRGKRHRFSRGCARGKKKKVHESPYWEDADVVRSSATGEGEESGLRTGKGEERGRKGGGGVGEDGQKVSINLGGFATRTKLYLADDERSGRPD